MHRPADAHERRRRAEGVMQQAVPAGFPVFPLHAQQLAHPVIQPVAAEIGGAVFQQQLGNAVEHLARDLVIDAVAEILGQHAQRVRGELHRKLGCLAAVARIVAAHVHDVGRCQPGAQDDTRFFEQPGVQLVFVDPDRVRSLLQAERPFFERAAQTAVGLLDREMAPVRAAEREELVQRQGMRRHLAHLLAQHGQDLRLLLCQHAQRDDAVRPQAERAVLVPADRAVPAERKRGGEQALDHRFPLAHADAALGQQRCAVFDQRHVGGRAADVHDDCILTPGQRAAAQRRGRRAGEQGLDRMLRRIRQPHQAGIRAHDQHLRVDAAFAERARDRGDEILRDRQ